ncbi:unnamed protein product, partial [Pylaiella littoralis]
MFQSREGMRVESPAAVAVEGQRQSEGPAQDKTVGKMPSAVSEDFGTPPMVFFPETSSSFGGSATPVGRRTKPSPATDSTLSPGNSQLHLERREAHRWFPAAAA